MLTKGMISAAMEAQTHPAKCAIAAARRAIARIDPAIDAARLGEVEEAHAHAKAAHDASRAARQALEIARNEAYQAALYSGATEPEAHAAAVSMTAEANEAAADAAGAARITRRALIMARRVAQDYSAKYN